MADLNHTTRLISENLARAIDRRTFLKRASQTTFAGLLALAGGHGLAGKAAATGGGPTPSQPPLRPQCAPPGPFCNLDGNTNEPNGCHGGHCFQHLHNGEVLQCRIYYTFYQTGCWTTPVAGGYWTCCDCECLNSGGQRVRTCGCAQFSTNPLPQPDGPAAKANT
jgi:hypothetical protein